MNLMELIKQKLILLSKEAELYSLFQCKHDKDWDVLVTVELKSSYGEGDDSISYYNLGRNSSFLTCRLCGFKFNHPCLEEFISFVKSNSSLGHGMYLTYPHNFRFDHGKISDLPDYSYLNNALTCDDFYNHFKILVEPHIGRDVVVIVLNCLELPRGNGLIAPKLNVVIEEPKRGCYLSSLAISLVDDA